MAELGWFEAGRTLPDSCYASKQAAVDASLRFAAKTWRSLHVLFPIANNFHLLPPPHKGHVRVQFRPPSQFEIPPLDTGMGVMALPPIEGRWISHWSAPEGSLNPH